MNIIELKNCSKKYNSNDFYSLKNINLVVEQGEIVGLIGPNGAGKTTLIKTISGLLKPSKYDSVKILGEDIYSNHTVNRKIGLILNSNQLYDDLSVMENIKFFLAMHKVKKSKKEILACLMKVNLHTRSNALVRNLSTGMKQKLNIVKTILVDVELLILDEPTSGMDPVSKSEIHNLLETLSVDLGLTILISSHTMNEIQKLCEKVIFMNEGEIIVNKKMDEIFEGFDSNVLKLRVSNDKRESLHQNISDLGISRYIAFDQNDAITVFIYEKIRERQNY